MCKMKATDKTKALQALIRLDSRGLATDSTADTVDLLGYEETFSDSESRDGEQTGIIVHGLLGSARNWRGFSRELANSFSKESGRSSLDFCIHFAALQRDRTTACGLNCCGVKVAVLPSMTRSWLQPLQLWNTCALKNTLSGTQALEVPESGSAVSWQLSGAEAPATA